MAETVRKRDAIEHLQRNSTVNALFNACAWRDSWWDHFAEQLEAEYFSVAVLDTMGKLVALVPLYFRKTRSRFGLRITRLEPIGSAWRHPGVAVTEYADIARLPGDEHRLADAIADALIETTRWSEFSATNTDSAGLWPKVVREIRRRGVFVRSVDPQYSYRIDLTSGLEDWKRRLRSGERRKLFNRRSAVDGLSFRVANSDELAHAIETAVPWQRHRWGKSPFDDRHGAFFYAALSKLRDADRLRVSWMSIDDRPISLMFCAHIGTIEYVLQSAFRPSDAAIGPGHLHLGLHVEMAASAGIQVVDLLMGEGRRDDYKARLATRKYPLLSFQCIRNPIAALPYRVAEALAEERTGS